MSGRRRNDVGSSSNAHPSKTSDLRRSIVTDVGRRRSSCGYCKSAGRTSFTHGLWAEDLTVHDYQDLLDRGWRRSGCYLYKPDMEKSCCPSYTIRLMAHKFVPSKEQLRVKKKLQRYLDGILDIRKQGRPGSSNLNLSSSNKNNQVENKHENDVKDGEFLCRISEKLDYLIYEYAKSWGFSHDFHLPRASIKKISEAKRKLFTDSFEILLYTTNIAFQMSATVKRAFSAKNARDGKYDVSLSEFSSDIIAEKLAGSLGQLDELSDMLVRACKGHINFYVVVKDFDENFQAIGASKRSGASSNSKDNYSTNRECQKIKSRRLEIRLNRSGFDPEEYALYRKYQIVVHHDNPDRVSESSYRRFLVDSPLIYVPYSGNDNVPMCGLGSFHQQYLIDGQLVAVGVIDILPRCLSSKYLFWDPDLSFLSLGKVSAIKEIEWVQENQILCPSLKYYYLGYYIHSCPKMRYKAAYRPSELLCPLHYQWVPFDAVKPLLDEKPYVVLSSVLQNGETAECNFLNCMDEEKDDLQEMNECEEMHDLGYEDSDEEMEPEITDLAMVEIDNNLYNVRMQLGGSQIRFKDILEFLSASQKNKLQAHLHQYMKAVGVKLSETMLYSLG